LDRHVRETATQPPAWYVVGALCQGPGAADAAVFSPPVLRARQGTTPSFEGPLTRGAQMCNACIARALARRALARPKAAAAHVPPAATG